MEDAKGLGRALSHYTNDYFTQVLVGFVVIYILYPFDCNALTVMFTLSYVLLGNYIFTSQKG